MFYLIYDIQIGYFTHCLLFGCSHRWLDRSLYEIYKEDEIGFIFTNMLISIPLFLISDSRGDAVVNLSLLKFFGAIPYLISFGPLPELLYTGPLPLMIYILSIILYSMYYEIEDIASTPKRFVILIKLLKIVSPGLFNLVLTFIETIFYNQYISILLFTVATIFKYFFIKKKDMELVTHILADGDQQIAASMSSHPQWPLFVKLSYLILKEIKDKGNVEEIRDLSKDIGIKDPEGIIKSLKNRIKEQESEDE